jgi:hypothetical protein
MAIGIGIEGAAEERVLELDEAGRGAAYKHMREGGFGARLLTVPGAQNPFLVNELERSAKRATRAA